MIDCDDLLDDLHQQTRKQVELAVIAQAPPVAAMHIDLALFSVEQTRLVEQLCDDG